MGAVVGVYFTMWPSVSHALGTGAATTGWTLSATLIGALVFQWPLGWLSDRFDRRTIILGGALMPLYSVCLADVNDRIDGSEMVAATRSFVLV